MSIHPCLEKQIELLYEKRYLDPDVKPAHEVGFWIRDFRQTFEQYYVQAQLDDSPAKFQIDLFGKFNAQLQRVNFTFRYRYDPANDSLTMFSLHAHLGRIAKTYYLKADTDLVSAQDVYQCLNGPIELKNNVPLHIDLYLGFRRDRDPANDHQEDIRPSKPIIKLPKIRH